MRRAFVCAGQRQVRGPGLQGSDGGQEPGRFANPGGLFESVGELN
jgi:hypothetical protein